jgi:uncharacterized protein YgfB (UPF0149 family)
VVNQGEGMKFFNYLLMMFFCFLSTNTIALTEIDSKDVALQNLMSDDSAMISDDDLDDWAQNFKEKFGFGDNNITEDGKKFIYASTPILFNELDAQYGNALISAYDEAMTKIQQQYVMMLFGKVMIDKVRSFYVDESTNAEEIKLPKPSVHGFLDKYFRVLSKRLDLAERKLDQKLIEAGVDVESLERIPLTKKKDIFRNSLIKTSLRKASGSMSGLIVVKTAIATRKNGQNYIGVIAIVSPKTKQIAKDINQNRKSLITGQGKNIKTLLPSNNQGFLKTFGTRLVYDQDGVPTILSYGLASYVPDNNSYIASNLKQRAQQSAINNADAQIAELVNGYMSVRNKDKSGIESKKYAQREIVANSDTLIKEIQNIVQVMSEKIKSSASVKLQGISTLKKWRLTTRNGQKFVGVVRFWSYKNLATVTGLRTGKFYKKRKSLRFINSLQDSKTINSVDDF